MQLIIDTESKTLTVEASDRHQRLALYSDEAFNLISKQWLKVAWNQRYPYTFSWMGRPIIQIPDDMVRIQEVIYEVKPDVVIETGVAHGGSLIFYASLFKASGHPARVIGVDIEIRQHNRQAIESHNLASYITLIEGDSTAVETLDRAKAEIHTKEKVLVILDSCHTKDHVTKELEAYHSFVTLGSYLVVTDGCMRDLYDVPLGKPEWQYDNPAAAAEDFVKRHPEFIVEQPKWPFNESSLSQNITHWPNAYLKRRTLQ